LLAFYSLVDGRLLLSHGRGLHTFTVREACNIAIAWQTDDFRREDHAFRWSGSKKESDDPVEVIIERWQEKIGLKVDPAAEALEAMKRFYKATGKDWDDTPVEVDWRMKDEEIPGTYMGGVKGVKGEGSK
jgi:hypothetical protein